MLKTIIFIIIAVVLGILGGNGAVVVFNHMPAKWLSEYGEPLKEDVLERQRLNSWPNKYLFSVLLVVAGAGLSIYDPFYALASMCAIWCMIIISAADAKYMILPDQFIVLLAVCGFGFINFHEKPIDMVYGLLIGAGCMLLVALLGKLIAKQEALGAGDIKLMGVLGFLLGIKGIIVTIIGMSFLSCGAFLILLGMKKIKKTDYQPLAPYICAAATCYLLVIWPL